MGRIVRLENRYEPLRERDFRRLIISRFTTKLGYWTTFIALFTIFVFETEIGPLGIGLLGIVEVAPNLFGSPALSVLTDRYDRKTIVLVTEIASGIAVAGLLVSQTLWFAYALVFFLGVMSAVAAPAQKALLPQMVEDDSLAQANALMTGTSSVAQITGPALGGLLITVVDPQVLFAIDAVTYVLSAIVVATMASYTVEGEDGDSVVADLTDGFRYVVRSGALVFAVGMALLIFGTLGVFDAMLPFFIREVLNEPSSVFGLLIAVVAGGSILSGIVIGGSNDIVDAKTGATAAAIADGIFLVGVALSSSVVVTGVFALGIGFCTTATTTYVSTLIQQTAEESYTGRVFGLYTSLARTGQMLAILFASLAVAGFGVRTTFGYVGSFLVVAVLGAVAYREFDTGVLTRSVE